MAKTTIIAGNVLVTLGVVVYIVSGMASATALIPAFFGAPMVALGWLATDERRHGWALGAAAGLGLLGALAPLGRLAPSIGAFELTLASASLIAMLLVCGVYSALALRALIAGRRRPAAV